jgi:hypothetical protein
MNVQSRCWTVSGGVYRTKLRITGGLADASRAEESRKSSTVLSSNFHLPMNTMYLNRLSTIALFGLNPAQGPLTVHRLIPSSRTDNPNTAASTAASWPDGAPQLVTLD